VGDALAELGLGGKMLGQMDGIAVAGELREAHHVGGRNGLRQGLGHAYREIFEIENAQRQDHRAKRSVYSTAAPPRECRMPTVR
jgi:hypothetical protein